MVTVLVDAFSVRLFMKPNMCPPGLYARVMVLLEATSRVLTSGIWEAKPIGENESKSVLASKISSAGTWTPAVTGCKALDTTARNLTLLGFELPREYPEQDSQVTLRARRHKLKANFLKPGTPNGMQDKDLDARKRDYTRGILA